MREGDSFDVYNKEPGGEIVTWGGRPMRSTRRLQNLHTAPMPWWKIENKKQEGIASIVSIYDEIGMFGVSAGDFLAELAGVDGDLDVHINSPGGDVFDAIAIYNQLKARRGIVSVTIDGLAASAASFIAQAASPGKLFMAPFSQMMIHDGFAAGIGNAKDMRDLADQLEAASDNIAAIYAERSGKSTAYWRAKMQATTWYKDQEAVDDGLADSVVGKDGAKNSWDLSVFNVDTSGDRKIGDGWVCGPDGDRFDPDNDGDDDSTPEGDTDHDYFDENGKQIKPVPSMPEHDCAEYGKKSNKKTGNKNKKSRPKNADVDNSPWDASKAWHNGASSDNPESFYRGICAGEKTTGDPKTQDHWALPYKYHPDDPPNAAGVKAALGRLSQTDDLKDASGTKDKLQRIMKQINPDYEPEDSIDSGLLAAVFGNSLKGE